MRLRFGTMVGMAREVPAPPRRVASERAWHIPPGGSRSCETVSPHHDGNVVEMSERHLLQPPSVSGEAGFRVFRGKKLGWVERWARRWGDFYH